VEALAVADVEHHSPCWSCVGSGDFASVTRGTSATDLGQLRQKWEALPEILRAPSPADRSSKFIRPGAPATKSQPTLAFLLWGGARRTHCPVGLARTVSLRYRFGVLMRAIGRRAGESALFALCWKPVSVEPRLGDGGAAGASSARSADSRVRRGSCPAAMTGQFGESTPKFEKGSSTDKARSISPGHRHARLRRSPTALARSGTRHSALLTRQQVVASLAGSAAEEVQSPAADRSLWHCQQNCRARVRGSNGSSRICSPASTRASRARLAQGADPQPDRPRNHP
jgi:hypothetical protein